MTIRIDPAALKETTWNEYIVRFISGGVTTVIAGLIAKKWGPTVGGLFLAFPAIFPASATLIEKHERQRKQKKGLHGERRGIDVAALDALGTAMGSLGLLAFAVLCRRLLPHYAAPGVLAGAALVWLLVGVCIWNIRKRC
jgi:hypothetical protein